MIYLKHLYVDYLHTKFEISLGYLLWNMKGTVKCDMAAMNRLYWLTEAVAEGEQSMS